MQQNKYYLKSYQLFLLILCLPNNTVDLGGQIKIAIKLWKIVSLTILAKNVENPGLKVIFIVVDLIISDRSIIK